MVDACTPDELLNGPRSRVCFLFTTSLAVYQDSAIVPVSLFPGSPVLLGLVAIGWMMNGAVDVLG